MDSELITIVGTILGSSLLTIGVLLRQMNHLETKLETRITGLDTEFSNKIDGLDTKFSKKIDGLDTKFSNKLDAMARGVSDTRERMARVEGYLMGPEGFRMSGPRSLAAVDPPPEDPTSGQR